MLSFLNILLGLLILPASVLAAPIYVIENGDGSTTFSSKAPAGGSKVKVFEGKKVSFSVYTVKERRSGPGRLHTDTFHQEIITECRKYALDPSLVKALIHVESGFNSKAVSPKGAQGLMQLMPATQKQYKIQNPFIPAENIRAGVKHLSMLLEKYKYNVKLALAAYNAGPEAVEQYGGIPPYKETINYVKRILKLREEYRKWLS